MMTDDESVQLAVQSRTNALYAAAFRPHPGGATAEQVIGEAREFAAFIQQG